MSDNKNKWTDEKILARLKEGYDLAIQYYGRDQRRMKMLDMTDNGDLWRAIQAKFPAYQILPDTNLVSYVKDNILASLYTTAKSAEVRPTSEDDQELCTKLNILLDHLWSTEDVGYKQFQAGERAALLNLGITQVGWDENVLIGNGEYQRKGKVVLKNIDPMNFMRDPFSDNLNEAAWCCTYNRYHKSVIRLNSKYKEKFDEWMKTNHGAGTTIAYPNYGRSRENVVDKDNYNLFVWWMRDPENPEQINEYHTIDTSVILYRKENIKPSVFPFAELYCNCPGNGLVGVSGPAKIFANDVAYNIMNSLALTAEYKNQRPPKFVSAQSGLNIPAFTKYGAEADRTFIVQQDAEKAVHYHQFPATSPQLPELMQSLAMDVQNVTGVDNRYTGRDTGSIITTGGTEEMLNRVTMIDTPKILNYEFYTKQLTKLVLSYMIQYSPKRKYFLQKPNTTEYESVEIDFPKIDKETLFDYDIQISSELPKNKQRVAAWADMIMEKQMQYREGGGQVELLTEEEWLMLQDIPFKELMLERMGFQRDTSALKETSQVLFQYANLIEQGMTPEDAMLQTAQTLENTRKGQPIEDAELQATMPMMGGGAPAPAPMDPEAMMAPLAQGMEGGMMPPDQSQLMM